jgi:ribosomal protein S18 acetylase RimI-like enzyme
MAVTFRKATSADRPAMLEICAAVWDGEDYLPFVFDEWVERPGGQFTAVEVDQRVIALAKLTRLAPGEYWLEGIRVHPAYRQQGIAAALHDYHLDLWRQFGEPGTLRLVTDSDNHAIIKLCERTGFTRIFSFSFVEASAQPGAEPNFELATPVDADQAFRLLSQLPVYAEQHRLCDLGWKWRELTPGYLAERIEARVVYRWQGWDGILLTMDETDEDSPGDTLFIQFPGAAPDQRMTFLTDVRALAHRLGKGKVRWSPLVDSALLSALPQVGYRRAWEAVEHCFEIRQ